MPSRDTLLENSDTGSSRVHTHQKNSTPVRVQAKLLLTERALEAAKTGLDGVTAQASELREKLSAEQKRAGTLANEVKHAGKASGPSL